MKVVNTNPSARAMAMLLAGALALPAAAPLAAQELDPESGQVMTVVDGMVPGDLSEMPEGPEVEGFIAMRKGERMMVRAADGTTTNVALSTATEVRAKGGFLGLSKDTLGTDALLNGLPVTVDTVQWGNGLIATRIAVKNKDLKTAAMIHNGTDQRFAANEAATEALRGRVADIDQYNIKGTTNVYFDTGKWKLAPGAETDLCSVAAEADAMDNALLLVVGYTDSVGSQDYNQVLSERRAGRVVNHLQQACGWKPWRMLSPTGMAEADPAADNETDYGRQQNRRVAVNILVSKSVDGM